MGATRNQAELEPYPIRKYVCTYVPVLCRIDATTITTATFAWTDLGACSPGRFYTHFISFREIVNKRYAMLRAVSFFKSVDVGINSKAIMELTTKFKNSTAERLQYVDISEIHKYSGQFAITQFVEKLTWNFFLKKKNRNLFTERSWDLKIGMQTYYSMPSKRSYPSEGRGPPFPQKLSGRTLLITTVQVYIIAKKCVQLPLI